MILSIHQPAYLPWLGYLDRIALSDCFVFLDTVQFEKNSYTNRNKIKTSTGPLWLTVPVKQQGHLEKKLTEIEIDNSQNWRAKHLRSIEHSYRRASNFVTCYPKLASCFSESETLLADLCFKQLLFWLKEFNITTPVVRASDLQVNGKKSDLVLAICQHLGAKGYLSGPQGRDYLDVSSFESNGVDVSFHEFAHPVYPQLHGDFLPAMSVVDYWMNVDSYAVFKSKEKA